jgi:predicted nucleotidyltransferase
VVVERRLVPARCCPLRIAEFCNSCDILQTEASAGGAVDVAHPIQSIIPSLDGPVLAALSGTTTALSLSETHRRAGAGSLSGVRAVLLRLQHAGIVDHSPGGYVLNREHVAAAAIEQLAGLHGELARRIRHALEQWPGEVLLAGLYGSAARRDGDEDSDIDVLVVSDSDALDDLVDVLSARIERWTGNRAQVIGKTSADIARLRKAGAAIVGSWQRELLVLVGDKRALGAAA